MFDRDGLEVVFPTGMHNGAHNPAGVSVQMTSFAEMFVTTWVEEQVEKLVCTPRNKACSNAPWQPVTEPNQVYIAGVTDYTVRASAAARLLAQL